MPVMLGASGTWFADFALHSAASCTRAITSSCGESSAILIFGSIGARSRITKATSASGCAAAGASVIVSPPADSASMRCGLNGGILAERSDTASDRLPATRTKGRTRTIS